MKHASTIFLQTLVALIGVAALAFLLVEPHMEGRNVGATLFEIYFHDPMLAYAYIASIPFFVGLYQIIKVLGYSAENMFASMESVGALQTLKYCALSMIPFVLGGEAWILLGTDPATEDHPPAIMMGLILIIASIAVAATAHKFARMARKQ